MKIESQVPAQNIEKEFGKIEQHLYLAHPATLPKPLLPNYIYTYVNLPSERKCAKVSDLNSSDEPIIHLRIHLLLVSIWKHEANDRVDIIENMKK